MRNGKPSMVLRIAERVDSNLEPQGIRVSGSSRSATASVSAG
jgi:hypothetical protein